MGENVKTIKVNYFEVNFPCSYNMIIRRPTFNVLRKVISMLYLTMKFSLNKGRIRVVKEDQNVERKCCQDTLRINRALMAFNMLYRQNTHNVSFVDLDPYKNTQKIKWNLLKTSKSFKSALKFSRLRNLATP